MANNLNSQVRAVNRQMKRSKRAVKVGASSALNKTADRIKSRVVKAVSTEENIQQKHIRKRVYISKSNPKKMRARVTAYQGDIPVISLGAKELKRGKGVSAPKRRYPNAFIADGSKGYGKYQGKGRYGSTKLARGHVLVRTSKSRYPLEVVKVEIRDSVKKHSPQIARKQMNDEYPRIAKHEIDYRLKKYADR